MPDRNEERMLVDTNVPVPPDDLRRLDLVVPGLNVHRGLPLFADVPAMTPLTSTGEARGGTSTRGGSLLEQAEADTDANYIRSCH